MGREREAELESLFEAVGKVTKRGLYIMGREVSSRARGEKPKHGSLKGERKKTSCKARAAIAGNTLKFYTSGNVGGVACQDKS
jgi:hypothetical protein